jgi:hypothetical protein
MREVKTERINRDIYRKGVLVAGKKEENGNEKVKDG